MAASVGATPDFKNDYTFDTLHRTTRIEQHGQSGGNSVAEKRVDLAYNALGQYTSVDRFADLAGTVLVATSSYSYDNLHRLTGLDHAQGATALAGYAYTYDAASRIASVDSLADGLATYSYDATSQLTAADHASQPDEAHVWDANGNPFGEDFEVAADNTLHEDANFIYEHDAEGNLTKKTDKITGDYVMYGWDHRNRLTSVAFYDAEDVLQKKVEYDYDLFDRRIAKRVDDDGDDDFDRAEKYVYDGEDIVLVFDDTGSLTSRFLHGPGADELFADERFVDDVLDDVYYPLTDHLGSVRDVAVYDSVLEETEVAKHITLDSFGKILTDSAPTLPFLYAYTGREWDPDAELYYYRARWFSPDMRRFISKDPIGFAAGDMNTSRYVGNDTLNASDPSGTESVGHHLIPWSLFANGTRTDPTLRVSRSVFNLLDSATIKNEFYIFHNFGPSNGIKHSEYTRLVKEQFDEYRKLWAANRGMRKGTMIPLTQIKPEEIEQFIKAIDKAGGKIGQFNEGIRREAEVAEMIGKMFGKSEAAKWGKAHRELQARLGDLADLTCRENLSPQNKKEIESLQRQIKQLRRQADGILFKLENALGEFAHTKTGRAALESAVELFSKVSGYVRTPVGRLLAVNGKRAFSFIPFVGTAYTYTQYNFIDATLDEATDYVPWFWAVKLMFINMIGDEEFDRVNKLTFQERAHEAAQLYAAWQNSWKFGVNEHQLATGQRVWVGMELRENELRDFRKVTLIMPFGPGEAIVTLSDGSTFQIRGYNNVDGK